MKELLTVSFRALSEYKEHFPLLGTDPVSKGVLFSEGVPNERVRQYARESIVNSVIYSI